VPDEQLQADLTALLGESWDSSLDKADVPVTVRMVEKTVGNRPLLTAIYKEALDLRASRLKREHEELELAAKDAEPDAETVERVLRLVRAKRIIDAEKKRLNAPQVQFQGDSA
jgi:hypothetical protein